MRGARTGKESAREGRTASQVWGGFSYPLGSLKEHENPKLWALGRRRRMAITAGRLVGAGRQANKSSQGGTWGGQGERKVLALRTRWKRGGCSQKVKEEGQSKKNFDNVELS